jgi:hypothetical protein
MEASISLCLATLSNEAPFRGFLFKMENQLRFGLTKTSEPARNGISRSSASYWSRLGLWVERLSRMTCISRSGLAATTWFMK